MSRARRERARAHLGHRLGHERARRGGLGAARLGQLGVGTARAAGPARWPPTPRGGPGSARSARGSGGHEDAPALLAGGDLAGRQGADLLDLHRGQLEVAAVAAVADEAGGAGPLEAGAQRLVAVRQRRRKQGRLLRARDADRRGQLGVDVALVAAATWPRSSSTCASSGALRSPRLPSSASIGSWSSMATSSCSSSSCPPVGQVPHLLVHRLQVAARRAGGGVHALLDGVAPLGDAGDLLLEVLLRGRRARHAAPPRRPPRSPARAAAPRRGTSPDVSTQGGARCWSWVMDVSRSCTASRWCEDRRSRHDPRRRRGPAAARRRAPASAMARASSQSHQRASGLSPGGGMRVGVAPSRR